MNVIAVFEHKMKKVHVKAPTIQLQNMNLEKQSFHNNKITIIILIILI